MTKATDASERRGYLRIQAKHILNHQAFVFGSKSDQKLFGGVIKNYSGGGALFESDIEYAKGNVVKLEIKVPGWNKFKTEFYKPGKTSASEPLIILATVIRCDAIDGTNKYDVAVKFVGIDEGHQRALIKQIQTSLG